MAFGLKEWAVVCEALVAGEQSLLLRKGGIDEPGGSFRLPADHFWLLPAHEHQRPELLRPPWDARCQPQAVAAASPLSIPAWAEVRAVHRVAGAVALERLADLHIFSADYAEQRLRWKPHQALWVVGVAVHRLDRPREVPWHGSYAGCTSFVELQPDVPAPDGGAPVLAPSALEARLDDLAARLR